MFWAFSDQFNDEDDGGGGDDDDDDDDENLWDYIVIFIHQTR